MEYKLPEEFTGEGIYVDAKAGVYAIVNPIGEIYIGQSTNIPERIRSHKKLGGKGYKALCSSMLRHGRKNHKFYLVKELDETDPQSIFFHWEKFYIQKLKSDGFILLNLNSGGSGAKKGHHYNNGQSILYPMMHKKWANI